MKKKLMVAGLNGWVAGLLSAFIIWHVAGMHFTLKKLTGPTRYKNLILYPRHAKEPAEQVMFEDCLFIQTDDKFVCSLKLDKEGQLTEITLFSSEQAGGVCNLFYSPEKKQTEKLIYSPNQKASSDVYRMLFDYNVDGIFDYRIQSENLKPETKQQSIDINGEWVEVDDFDGREYTAKKMNTDYVFAPDSGWVVKELQE